MVKITLILAVKSSDETLTRECVASINMQTCELDVIVIDGGCSEQVLRILRNINKKNVSITKSEPKGIYNAYNIGITQLNYGYAFFMGIDDRFYDCNSVTNAYFELVKEREPILLLTCFLEINASRKKFPVLYIFEKFLYGYSPMMHHQGLLVDAGILKQYKFNEQLKIFADQVQFHEMKKKYAVRCAKVNFIISKTGGASTSGSQNVEIESRLLGFHSFYSRLIYKLFFILR